MYNYKLENRNLHKFHIAWEDVVSSFYALQIHLICHNPNLVYEVTFFINCEVCLPSLHFLNTASI
jgi:hypothetical protein